MAKSRKSDIYKKVQEEILNIADCVSALQTTFDNLAAQKVESGNFQNLFDIYGELQTKVNSLEKSLMIFEENHS